jgi:predicted esterase
MSINIQPAELRLSFTSKANYFKIGEISDTTRQVWFVLHGYGQLARFFIKKFSKLADYNICVIAPEGLSRFYLEDVTSRSRTGDQRVGASWMTRENRLMDIHNYVTYLNTLYDTEVGNKKIEVSILGFSQGAATASRWIVDGHIAFEQLILWAGLFPPDMDFEKGKLLLKNKKVVTVYGKHDPFLRDDRFVELKVLTSKLDLEPEVISFEGGHDIDEDALVKLVG